MAVTLRLPAPAGEALLTGEAGESAGLVALLSSHSHYVGGDKADNAWLACRCAASGRAEPSGTRCLEAASQHDLHCLLVADMPSVEDMAELNALQGEDVCMLPIPCNSPAVAAAVAHRRRHALNLLHTQCKEVLCGAEAAQECHSAATALADDEPQDMQVSPLHLVALNAAGELRKVSH